MITQKINEFGLSLLEVLISLVLISLILLSFDATQIIMIKHFKNNFYFAIAELEISNVFERMRAQKGWCNLEKWNSDITTLLPEGKGEIQSSDSASKISLSWRDNLGKMQQLQVDYEPA